MARAVCRCVLLLVAVVGAVPEASGQPLPDLTPSFPWVFDGGSVSSHAKVNDRLYVGGSFTGVARPSDVIGPFAVFSNDSAQLVAADPSLRNTQTRAIEADGSGGWFVATNSIPSILHYDSTGRRLPWASPSVSGFSSIYDMERVGSVLYVAGSFSGFNSVPRSHVAAFDVSTGEILAWNPGVEGSYVKVIAGFGGEIFLGGSFTAVGGIPRANLASVNAVSGAVSAWAPIVSGESWATVHAIAHSATTVLVGGSFNTVNGQSRDSFVAIDRTSGNLRATPFSLAAQSLVQTITVSGDTAYVGGEMRFGSGGNTVYAAAMRISTGERLPWHPTDVGAGYGIVSSAQATPNGIVLGGIFPVNGRRRHLIMVHPSTGALVTEWNPSPGATVSAVATQGSHVAVGGLFQTYRAVAAAGIAGFDLSTDTVLSLPTAWGTVQALSATQNSLIVGGTFRWFGTSRRTGLAALRLSDHAMTSFSPEPRVLSLQRMAWSSVACMVTSGDTIYIGGQFDHIGDTPRDSFAAFSATTGQLLPFDPFLSGEMKGNCQLAIAGESLWFAGTIAGADGQPPKRLAALNLTTGASSPVNSVLETIAVSNDSPVSVAAWQNTVYLSGGFTQVAGARRAGLARVNAMTGNLDGWVPPLMEGRGSIAPASDMVIAAVSAGAGSYRLEGMEPVNGHPLSWSYESSTIGDRDTVAIYSDSVVVQGETGLQIFPRRVDTSLKALADFGIFLQGNRLLLRWTPSLNGAAPDGYRLTAGTAPGRVDVEVDLTGPEGGATTSFSTDVPDGVYYLRMAPRRNGSTGPWTPEIGIVPGATGCTTVPVSTRMNVNDSVLSWSPVAGATGYSLRVGTASGDLTLMDLRLPASQTSLSTEGAPPATYFVAVAALNACGAGPVSNEATAVVTAPLPPAPPTGLNATVNGSTVTLRWTAPAGTITGYSLEVGSSSGLSDILPSVPHGTTPLLIAPSVPRGDYYVRVRAVGRGGASALSNEVLVRVP